MLYKYNLRTDKEGFYDVTAQVNESVRKSEVDNGICVIFCPHTTAGMTINENADPDVVSDMLLLLKRQYLIDLSLDILKGIPQLM